MTQQTTFLGIPYNWHLPTWKKINQRIWNKSDNRLFPPKAFGWGYDINFYELLHRRKKLLIAIAATVAVLGFYVVKQAVYVNKAHQTFENYYAFRGCTTLIKQTSTYGICKTGSGQIIKIVKFNGKWYLDGDLPICLFHICN